VDSSANLILFFPAFLMGSVFGVLTVVMRSGTDLSKNVRAVVFCVAGSLAGGVIFLLTQSLWPPIIAPFILCPIVAAIAGFFAGKRPLD